MINGIINVYKETGFTSFDVVAKLRGITRIRKIGHTGTLDPDATGVLPVCIGSATKLCDMLTDKTKEYEATFRLGITTDTQDISGKVLEEKEVYITEEQLKECISTFIGKQQQIPPMYSAIKINGQKLYDLARAGKEVERAPRDIEISKIEIKHIETDDGICTGAVIAVGCSKGTYIRSICHDLGERLGTVACMGDLQRTRVGQFAISEALTLEECLTLAAEGKIEEKLISVDAIYDYPKIFVEDPEAERLLLNGNRLHKKGLGKDFKPGLYKMINRAGRLCSIYELKEDATYMYPYIVFPENK